MTSAHGALVEAIRSGDAERAAAAPYALFATVKEPARRSLEGAVEKTSDAPGLPETLRFIWSQSSLVRYFTSYVLMVLATAATLSFLPSFYLRAHGLAFDAIAPRTRTAA